MKILVFTGGLGNQIFEYAFYLHLKSCFPLEKFYGHYGKKLQEHYGLELNKWFKVSLPKEKWWILPFLGVMYMYKQLFPKSKMLDLHQREWKNKSAIVYFPFKFSKHYLPNDNNWLQWNIDDKPLTSKNKSLINIINKEQACFIHVRRGDYLASNYKELFEGCCTIEYYKKAINLVKGKYPDIRFICFSDDMLWMKQNLSVGDNAIFVDWNKGTDSPLDMYLMSQCQCGIIANSTFSYWGASLGKIKDIIIYPSKWWNHINGNPDIFMDKWIGL